jgi:sodium transport system permease protein
VDRTPLNDRRVDLLLVVPPDFREQLEKGGRPALYVLGRAQDDHARLVQGRVALVLNRWKKQLKEVRLLRRGLPADYDEPFAVRDPDEARPVATKAADDLFGMLIRVFPFILVLWSLAGALYPAIDLCAGEKERGTMETLLVSPASREEIVWGKFLTIWVFSAATALVNLLSMGLTAWQFGSQMPPEAFRPLALFWGVVLLLPLSAFFSAVSLSVGAYARSSKEGQYYLMPLFLVTMPLIFLTLAPGVTLNPFYSMVPVTGVALLLQKLMAAGTPDRELWLYFVPVLAPMVLYSWLALRWAIEQFQREEVLFREAERLDLGLWLRHLLRDKEALPSAGEAFFGFGLIFGLHWLSFHVGTRLSLLARTGISQLAFVAAPTLFMALLLTTRPRQGLALRRPPWWSWPAAALLAVAVVQPLATLTVFILQQFPALRDELERYQLAGELHAFLRRGDVSPGWYFLVLALVPAVCEELAFRGFLLSGLRQRFRPGTAVLLSSFLFALYQMNVFQFVPNFVFGAILALLVVRCGSLWPALVFHLVYNALLLGPVLLPGWFRGLPYVGDGPPDHPLRRLLLAAGCTALAAGVLGAVSLLGRRPAPAALERIRKAL